MVEALLRELSNVDIDWLVAMGERQAIAAGTVLIRSGAHPDPLYVVLDGQLAIRSTVGDPADAGSIIDQLGQGEIAGEATLYMTCPIAATIQAIEPTQVLAIARQPLVTKLYGDATFGAHFNRAMTLMLSERLRRLLEQPGQVQITTPPVKDALFVFSELQDSDIDWLVAAGQLVKLTPGQVLSQAGRPVESLSIILDGSLLVEVPQAHANPFMLCFDAATQASDRTPAQQSAQDIDRLYRGQTTGLGALPGIRDLPTTVTAMEESLVLNIPRRPLATKLNQDLGFADRFYRILAIQLSNRLQLVMNQLGCRHQLYQLDQAMDESAFYDDELCLYALTQVTQGAKRFNWMLQRLGVSS